MQLLDLETRRLRNEQTKAGLVNYADLSRDFEDVLSIFYHQVKVDGFFTDFPDKVVHFIEKQSRNTYKYIRK